VEFHPHVRMQLNLVALCFGYIKPPLLSIIGLPLNVETYNAEKYSVGRKERVENSSALNSLLRLRYMEVYTNLQK